MAICRNVAVVPQPSPAMNPGGDCFACATTAALRHFFPHLDIQLPAVFERFWSEHTRGDTGEKTRHLDNTWWGYRGAFYRMFDLLDQKLEIVADVVLPHADVERYSHDWGFGIDGYDYARRLEAWLAAGYLAFASIRYAASPSGEWVAGPNGPQRCHTDHLVLLDGVRYGIRPHPTVQGAGTYVYQVHVVCSARGGRTYWIDVDRLLRDHGAGAWWLIRPSQSIGYLPDEPLTDVLEQLRVLDGGEGWQGEDGG